MSAFFPEQTPEQRIAANAAFGFPFGPQEEMDWYGCERCGLGRIGSRRSGPSWQEHHECPEPFPRKVAEQMAAVIVASGQPIHPTIKARIKLGLEQ